MAGIKILTNLLCDESKIVVTPVSVSPYSNGAYCIAWCIDLNASVVDDVKPAFYSADNVYDEWVASIANTAAAHYILVIGVEGWVPGTYPAGSIRWFNGAYWQADAETSDVPGESMVWGIPAFDMAALESIWWPFYNETSTYSNYTYLNRCNAINCESLQVEIGYPEQFCPTET